jgi:hypothetical protein
LYRTVFFGSFIIGNASDVAILDYSYNYFTISDSNINSSVQTLIAFDASNILINSNSRLAFPDSPLNLTLIPQLGYDISFDSSIKYGVQTINSNQRLFDNSAIYYNANILSLSNNLVNGTLGLSFELYKTGFFGTFIIANLIYTIMQLIGKNEKVLIVVPDIGLVEQTYKDFISYNFPMSTVTKWSGNNEIDTNARVIIANMGILQSEKSDLSWFKEVGMLIVDECHKLRRGNKVNKLIDKIPTLRRFGFTGTLPESDIDTWNINNFIGPVIFKRTTTNLREAAGGEYIANAQALAVHLEYVSSKAS